jgi:HD-GYP domain-containing protein (c-di-GMP phosphodiesterase class II)
MFMPRLVEAFNKLAKKEYFWLDASYTHLNETISRALSNELIELDVERQLSLTNIIRQIIDFRSSVTATHSSGVATVAEELGRLAGFSERECGMMRMAGYLHDLGKLAVPAEILEKPGKLTKKEFNVVRGHTFYTYRILEPIAAFSTVNNWASLHHERLDGTGYPFKIKGADLSLGARIIAVADVFSAITEDRPYRKGMSSKGALGVLQRMADNSRLDPIIVSLLSHNFAAIDSLRTAAQATAAEEYRQFYQG